MYFCFKTLEEIQNAHTRCNSNSFNSIVRSTSFVQPITEDKTLICASARRAEKKCTKSISLFPDAPTDDTQNPMHSSLLCITFVRVKHYCSPIHSVAARYITIVRTARTKQFFTSRQANEIRVRLRPHCGTQSDEYSTSCVTSWCFVDAETKTKHIFTIWRSICGRREPKDSILTNYICILCGRYEPCVFTKFA